MTGPDSPNTSPSSCELIGGGRPGSSLADQLRASRQGREVSSAAPSVMSPVPSMRQRLLRWKLPLHAPAQVPVSCRCPGFVSRAGFRPERVLCVPAIMLRPCTCFRLRRPPSLRSPYPSKPAVQAPLLPVSSSDITPASDGSQRAAGSPLFNDADRFRDSAMESSRPQTSPSSGNSSNNQARDTHLWIASSMSRVPAVFMRGPIPLGSPLRSSLHPAWMLVCRRCHSIPDTGARATFERLAAVISTFPVPARAAHPVV